MRLAAAALWVAAAVAAGALWARADETAKTAKAAKAGEAKAGDGKTGDGKTGEAKTGEAKTGEAKTGEAKSASEKAVPRIWWSFPNDDETAIEVDDADLDTEGGDRFATRAKFAAAMQKCNYRRSKVLAQHKDGTPVREIRLESVGADGKSSNTRCVMTLKDWRTRIGKDLVYRLDDELDAHASFLMPRRRPGMPARVGLTPDMGPPDLGTP